MSCEDWLAATLGHFHERQVKLKRGSGPMPVVALALGHWQLKLSLSRTPSSFPLDVHQTGTGMSVFPPSRW